MALAAFPNQVTFLGTPLTYSLKEFYPTKECLTLGLATKKQMQTSTLYQGQQMQPLNAFASLMVIRFILQRATYFQIKLGLENYSPIFGTQKIILAEPKVALQQNGALITLFLAIKRV